MTDIPMAKRDLPETLYQDNLRRLSEKAQGKELLNLRETAEILGFRDVRTVKKRFPFVDGYISVATLARCLTPKGEEIHTVKL